MITRDDVQKLPANQTNLPVLRTGLPRRAPAENAVLPDLLTNLPGTATMAYHSPESQSDDVGGWPSEDVLFYSADGAWRRLQLEDLGLPESAWPGGDTFGAGNLSPNGRWWTAPSDAGVIVLSLSTGSTQLIDLTGGYAVSPQWLPDSSAFVARTFERGSGYATVKVTIPEGTIGRVPYSALDVGFEPDGTPVSVERTEDGARVVEWRGRETIIRGTVTPTVASLPSPDTPQLTQETLAFYAGRGKSRLYDLVAVDSSRDTVESALRLPDRTKPLTIVHGWLGAGTLLIATKTHLVSWRPEEGVNRVTGIPRLQPGRYWTVSVALDHRSLN